MIEEITITSLAGRGSVTMRTRDAEGYWLGRVDWGQAEGSHQTYSAYNQIGETITSTQLGTRPLTIPGWVIENTDGSLLQRCEFLDSFISPVEDYELEYNGRKIRFRPDNSVIYSREMSTNNKLLRKFMIQATCPFPLFSRIEDLITPFDFSTKKFKFPTDFGRAAPLLFGVTEKVYNTVLNNPGGFASGVTIDIRFTGTVQNPRVRDMATGEFAGVKYTFQPGERLILSTVTGSKSITLEKADGEEINLIKHRDVDMSWIQLTPGSSTWALECEDLSQRDAMQVAVSFTPLYLEVE